MAWCAFAVALGGGIGLGLASPVALAVQPTEPASPSGEVVDPTESFEIDDVETVEVGEPSEPAAASEPSEPPEPAALESAVNDSSIGGQEPASNEPPSVGASTEAVGDGSEASEPLPGDTPPGGIPDEESTTAADAPDERPTVRQRLSAVAEHVHFGGFIQVDFLRRQISEDELSDGTREPLNETEFVLRNARVGADADWRFVGVTGYAELFSNGEGVRPATFDVHAQLPGKDGRPPWVQLRAGLLRVPFGFENGDQNDAQRFFGERTAVSHAFVPGLFDVGASLSGQLWALRWIVAVHNGQPVGAPGFGYRDPNAAKDYVGRLHVRGDVFSWLDAAIGFSFLSGKGFSAGTPATKDSFDWVDLNEDGRVTVAEIIPVSGTAGRPSENFSRWGLGADVQLRSELPKVGQLMVYGEFAAGKNLDRAIAIADPVLLRRDQRGVGWYVGLTQQLTRHATVGVRFDQYHPDLDALEPFDGTTVITRRRFQTISGGAAAHLYQGQDVSARLLVEYEHQRNSLGRNDQGRPAQLDNDTVRVRAEVVF